MLELNVLNSDSFNSLTPGVKNSIACWCRSPLPIAAVRRRAEHGPNAQTAVIPRRRGGPVESIAAVLKTGKTFCAKICEVASLCTTNDYPEARRDLDVAVL
jgi:hypothetical protein